MFKRNLGIFSVSLLVLILTVLVAFLLIRNQQKKIAVVDAVKLFNAYNMKVDLEKNAEVTLRYLTGKLDSIEKEMRIQNQLKNMDNEKQLVQQYQGIKQALDNEYIRSNREINEMVWKRLNPLIDEYGKDHELHLIIGANGMGSVLYNDNYYDHTSALIEYVNGKYESGN